MFNLPDLLREIGDTSVARGRGYQRDKRVLQMAVDPDDLLVTGEVRGSGGKTYRQTIQLLQEERGTGIDGECTCPVGHNCKHVAAVLLEVMRLGGRPPARVRGRRGPAPGGKPGGLAGSKPGGVPRGNLVPLVHTLPHRPGRLSAPPVAALIPDELELWLAKVRGAARPVTERDAYDRTVRHRLLYVLEPDARHPGVVRAELYTGFLKNDGGYSKLTRYRGNPYQISEATQAYILAVDKALIAAMLTLSYQAGSGSGLTGEAGADLLQRMVATGRCHWAKADHPPLVPSAAMTTTLVWRTDPDGSQRLVPELPSATVLVGVSPPWYVDTSTWQCGPLETGVAPRLASVLAAAPSVAPEYAARIGAALAGVNAAALPLPRVLPERFVADVKPVPCLSLGSYEWRHATYYSRQAANHVADIAQLSFDYLGQRVSGAAAATLTCVADNELLRVARHQRGERAARDVLKQAGFRRDDASPSLLGAEYDLQQGEAWILPDGDFWLDFMSETVPKLREVGWRIDVAESFRYQIAVPEAWYGELSEGRELGSDWFGLELGIVIDGEKIPLLPILSRLLARQPELFAVRNSAAPADERKIIVTLPDGRNLALPLARARSIVGTLVELYRRDPNAEALTLSRLDAGRLIDLDAALDLRWMGGERLIALGRRLRDFQGIRPVIPPAGLDATLRPYQQQGLNWLQFLREYELAGILADDMGLGKTIQTLAHLLLEKASGRADRPSLVIAPTSLMHNWKSEAGRFAPELRVLILQGIERKKDFERLDDYDLVLTTYPLLHRDKEILLGREYHLLILDEAQNIKNPKAQAAVIARQINARHRLCLTGTPMENHLGEMWSLFHFLTPGLLGDLRQFNQFYRTPIEKHGDVDRRAALSRRVAPFLLRRSKDTVAAELPPKTEIIRTVELSAGQRDLYETIRVAMEKKVRDEIAAKGLARSHIIILDALLKLRQVCCDPRLVKLEKAKRIGDSAKLDLLMTIVPELLSEGRRILVFSQFTSMLALIEAELVRHKIGYALLTGDTKDRKGAIESFQSGRVPLFLISLKAGGVGLNLTAADTVIHYDPWWNPAVENQATDRAHRIGQDKPVFVYKLIAAGSVEEKIVAMQQRKAALAEGILSGKGEIGEALTSADLEVLFEPLT